MGLNELRFEASDARELERQLSFRLDRLELEPDGPDCGPVETATAGDSFTLAPGALLLVQTPLPPRAELALELTGDPDSRVELYLSRNGTPQRRIDLATGEGHLAERLTVGDLVSTELVAVGRGPGITTVRILEISGDERPAAWRAACELLWKEPLAAAGLLGLLVFAVAVGRRWPDSRAGLWLDCTVLLALAATLRFAYLSAYPELDPGRFGDSWEYLQRSRYLLKGVPFWSDTSWHAWLTWIRPPGYYLFLAGFLGPLGGGLTMIAKIQAVLLAATVVAGYLVAYPLFGRGSALATGLLIAFYPQMITSASWILSDPLALFLTTTALACLSWLAVRPRWPLALVAGAIFGLGCLVRSAPLYFVPLAALLLYLGQRAPRRKAPALALAGAALLVVLPWCVRNSTIYGKPMGIDDLMIPNFLMAHPDPEILPAELEASGVWGEADEAREQYFRWLWRGNTGARLTLDSGRILGRGLVRMAASPGTTLRRFGLHLKIYFQRFPRLYSAHFLGESDGCRVSSWTDALNLIYLPTLILAIPGAVLALRRRQSWPLIAWILFFVVVTNLFFYPSYMPGRYRLPIYPALAALAGLALSRTGEALVDLFRRHRRPAAGA
jgi:4-amino-4-deoxy-L-arabinose transferase-like glycosyltransferase